MAQDLIMNFVRVRQTQEVRYNKTLLLTRKALTSDQAGVLYLGKGKIDQTFRALTNL